MKDKPKLGRGLDDVSQHFLSRVPLRPVAASQAQASRSVAVCHPGSLSLQSFLLTNLALELAKRRHRIRVHDFSPHGETCVKTLMGSVISDDDSHGSAIVRLYGLPEIQIIEKKADDAIPEDMNPDCGEDGQQGMPARYLLLNTPGTLEFFLKGITCSEYILAAKTDEKSLLQAYAFCKVMRDMGALRIHMVFDEAPAGEKADRIFRQFAGFVVRRLGCDMRFLGTLSPDERVQRSMRECLPLVLSKGGAAAGIWLSEMCDRLLESEDQASLQTGKGA